MAGQDRDGAPCRWLTAQCFECLSRVEGGSQPMVGGQMWERLIQRKEKVGQLVYVSLIHSGYNRLFLPFMFGPLDLICS